jgi:DNA repair protein RecO (recombination protein O)
MSVIVKTEAVVLKSIKFRETSKIITLFTRELGMISAIVKGARGTKSTYGMSLEPMSHIATMIYDKKGREVQLAAQCETLHTFRGLYEDLEKMQAGMQVIEMVRCAAHEQEKNTELFRLIAGALSDINDADINCATQNVPNMLLKFEIEFASVLGFAPNFAHCLSCGKDVFRGNKTGESLNFYLEKGAPLCGSCDPIAGRKVAIHLNALRALNQLSDGEGIKSAAGVVIDVSTGQEIDAFLWNFLQYHVSGIRPLRSKKVFASMGKIDPLPSPDKVGGIPSPPWGEGRKSMKTSIDEI